ncbi:MAG: hypothetical protein PHF63_11975 [Herbinix sp.]|nr:hypothetical protein [Herbinix sp.]
MSKKEREYLEKFSPITLILFKGKDLEKYLKLRREITKSYRERLKCCAS